MKLELRTAGTHFVICICGEKSERQIVVPLSAEISDHIERLMKAEGVKTGGAILPVHVQN